MTQARPRILVVDDDLNVRDSMHKWLQMDGYDVVGAEDASVALALLQREHFDLALVDIRMPGMDGVELQRRIREVEPGLPLVIITAYASVETAVQVLKRGAMDYLTKPVDPDDLSRMVRRALAPRDATARGSDGAASIEAGLSETLVGQSPAIAQVRALVADAGRSDQPVLIVGEQGTGRHAAAAAIHASSQRRFFDLIPLDCAALTEGSLERKALLPTAARKLKLADGGTLLLDALDELPPALHGALLQLLECPTPSARGARAIDFRPIAISRRPLRPLVEAGGFSERLFYRLAVLVIDTPPLRARQTDIPLIAAALLQRIREHDAAFGALEALSADATERLTAYSWPGNVAELEGVIRRAATVATPPRIVASDLGQLDGGRG